MLNKVIKGRIRLYSPKENDCCKAQRRRADADEVARGNATVLQQKNRALPHASQMVLCDLERELPQA